MHVDRIEHELEIDAPIGVVWRLITEPAHIAAWFTDYAELDVRPGGKGRFGWVDKATTRAATANVRVEDVLQPYVFSFRWDFPDGAEPDETNAPLVRFTLVDAGGSTRVTLVESGCNAVERSDAAAITYYEEHVKGWPQICARLIDHAASVSPSVAA